MARPDDDNNSAMSFLDVFANGLGAVLLLMVFFAIGLTGHIGRPTPPEEQPLVINLSWRTDLPPAGLGTSRLELKLVRSDGAPTTQLKVFNASRTVGIGADVAPNGAVVSHAPARGLTLFPGVMPTNSRWRIEVRINTDPPTELPQPEFDALSKKLQQLRTDLQRTSTSDTPRKRVELNELADAYLSFHARLASLRKEWGEQELQIQMPADADANWFAMVARRRAEAVSAAFDDISVNEVKYPLPASDKSGFYDPENPARFFDVDPGSDKLKPRPFALDAAVTRRSWIELSAPGEPSHLLLRRWMWVSTIKQLSLPDARLVCSFRFEGAGMSAKPIEVAIREPLNYCDADGWRQIAELRIDERRRASIAWESSQRVEVNARPQLAPPVVELVPPTRWEVALHNFDPTFGDDNALTRIDRALTALGGAISADGRAGKAVDNTYFGAGVDGLSLLAFCERGHGVNAAASEFADKTRPLAARLCESGLQGGDRLRCSLDQNAPSVSVYHFGFALIALSRSLDEFDGAAPPTRVTDGATLSRLDFERAIGNAVDFALDGGNVGSMHRFETASELGWGYTGGTIDDADTSVCAVMAKALADVRKSNHDIPDLNKRIDVALPKISSIFVTARAPGWYRYRCGRNEVGAPSDGERRAGCLLGESFGVAVGPAWMNLFNDFAAAHPPALTSTHAHYALFYGAYLMQAKAPIDQRRKWFIAQRRHLFQHQGVVSDTLAGDLSADQEALYRHAMAIVVLSLPLQTEVIEAFRNPR